MIAGRVGLVLVAFALVAIEQELVKAQIDQSGLVDQSRKVYLLQRLRHKFSKEVLKAPDEFDIIDVQKFNTDDMFAERFLFQRSGKLKRAVRLAASTLKWRHQTGINRVQAHDFPCNLFSLGLIFQYGLTHRRQFNGQFVGGSPIIWIRVGALGSVIKQMEKLTPARLVSFAYNTPRDIVAKVGRKVSRTVRRKLLRSRSSRAKYAARKKNRLITNYSVGDNETILHVLRSISWWLEQWMIQNPGSEATLVLDFENTDFAFASWTIGDFFVNLDDHFPNLFNQIIGFRYKPKLWSLHGPISMFNRIFQSRFSSSPETDRKLVFVPTESQISPYLPRVDANGFTLLPEHVSGVCVAQNYATPPAGCTQEPQINGLYDANFWQVIHNEFYYKCTAKPAVH